MAVLLMTDTLELVVVLTEFVAIGVRERWAKETTGARSTAKVAIAIQADISQLCVLWKCSIMENLRSNSLKIKGFLFTKR